MTKTTKISRKVLMQETDPIMPVLRAMKKDDTRSWQKRRRAVVRGAMYQIADTLGYKFITRVSEEKIYVTRVK